MSEVHGARMPVPPISASKIFKGEHVKHKNNIAILEGREITVEFDRPTPLQIDGETILGISSYKTKAHYHDMVNA